MTELEKQYFYACFLYYYGMGDEQSPWTDYQFDYVQGNLEASWDLRSDEFKARTIKGQLKVEAHSYTYSEEEKQAARDWMNSF